MEQLFTPLNDKELEALDHFLAAPVREDTSMDVATLEGFLVTLAIGPELVMPSDWVPWVWDLYDGEADAQFKDQDEAERIMQLVMRFYNQVLEQFANDPQGFEPIYWRSPVWGATEWCEGFLLGTSLTEEAWTPLLVEHPDWFEPFMRLGTNEGLAITDQAACQASAILAGNGVNRDALLKGLMEIRDNQRITDQNPEEKYQASAHQRNTSQYGLKSGKLTYNIQGNQNDWHICNQWGQGNLDPGTNPMAKGFCYHKGKQRTR